MEQKESSTKKTRRRFMTMAGVGAGGLLAGCAGNSGSSTSTTESDDDESIVTDNSDGQRFDGVTMELWDWFGVNTGQEGFIRDLVKEFENNTGATVKLTFGSGMYDAWPKQIRNGEGPNMHSFTPPLGVGLDPQHYYTADEMMKEHSDKFDDDTIGDLEWQFPGIEYLARGLPDMDVPHFPIFNSPRSPILARQDAIEQAGLAEDFPPETFEEAIELSKQLQNNSDVEYGFQVPGSGGDILGFFWSQLPGTGEKETTSLMNEDVTDVQVNNEAWTEVAERFQHLLDEGVIAPDTASLGGSAVSAQIATTKRYGQVNPEPKHHKSVEASNPSVLKDGTLRWYPMWGDDKSNQTPWSYNIIPQDEGCNKEQRRQEAAVHFMSDYLLSDGFHETMAARSGFIPSKKDTWDAAANNVQWEDKHHWFDACRTQMNNGGAWSLGYGSPEVGDIVPILGGAGQYLPQFLTGDMTIEEAMDNWYQTAREDMGLE
jgi:ABC-type glycerol-3-phosphate transport system substrate-binding protein